MDSRFDRIEQKLDRIVEVQAEIRADLQEHIRRTEIAEQNIDALTARISPIQEHVAFVRGLGRLTLTLTAIVGAAAAVLQALLTH